METLSIGASQTELEGSAPRLTMMKHWVITATIDPTKLTGTVTGRFGASIMTVAYSRLLRQWYWVFGGGGEQEIGEPPMIFVEEDWARENRTLGLCPKAIKTESSHRIRKKREEQLVFL